MNRDALLLGALLVAATAVAACGEPTAMTGDDDAPAGGQTRTYYIAAEREAWDYAPSGINRITGEPFDATANVYLESGPDRIGRVHDKALYHAYTDATFTTRGPAQPGEEHLGLLGPVVRAAVGDTIEIVFKNNTEHPVSVHPHGVFYDKRNEGTPYDDGTPADEKADNSVPPGQSYTYHWAVPDRAGPGPMDGSSILWMYHSHVDEPADTNAGLIGPIVVTARAHACPTRRPDDVDRELFTLFTIFDENTSFYLHDNVEKYCGARQRRREGRGLPGEQQAPLHQRARLRQPRGATHARGGAGALVRLRPGDGGRRPHAALARQHGGGDGDAHRRGLAPAHGDAGGGHDP